MSYPNEDFCPWGDITEIVGRLILNMLSLELFENNDGLLGDDQSQTNMRMINIVPSS